MSATTTATKLRAVNLKHLDASVAQESVGILVLRVGNDNARAKRDDIVAIVPLLSRGLKLVTAGRNDAEFPGVECTAKCFEKVGLFANIECTGQTWSDAESSNPVDHRARAARSSAPSFVH